MEIKFNQTGVNFLRSLTEQTQTREETQEIRLPEGMPDIGRILGCWGQPVVRGKEWRSGGMGISGGVMAWVLYAPEDGSAPQTVETWIPFQQKWDFEDNHRDGCIWVQPVLKAMDARSVSPRKIMARANVSTLGRALQTAQEEVYQPDGAPEDVELLRQTYPLELPRECGEKQMELEEELPLPDAGMEKLLRYCLTPRITEQKILGPRLVFRGICDLKLLYMAGEKLHSWDAEVPFSQFADLDQDFTAGAQADVMPLVTDLELSMADGQLHLKAAMAAQYTVYDRVSVELVEDAYSPRRAVEPQTQELRLPVRLDSWLDQVEQSQVIPCEMGTLVDISTLMDIPQCRGADVIVSGSHQILYYDPEGNLQNGAVRFEQPVPVEQGPDVDLWCEASLWEKPKIGISGEGVTVTQPMELAFSVTGRRGMPMVTGLEQGEILEPDPGRPSLILCRCKNGSLWELAKEHGSTVSAIRSANGLEGEPEPARMLLIPIA